MKIITNEKIIKKNRLIGQITTFTSMGILGLGLYLSFKQLYITWSFAALLAGFILSQVGIFYGSRWGKSPRPDEILNQALKGLDHKFTIFHYASPVSHLLTGPAGVWILLPFSQKGTITFDEKSGRWKQKGGNMYMKLFAQEGLGRPDLEVTSQEKSLRTFISKNLTETSSPEINTALVFSNENAILEIESASRPTLNGKKVKDFIRRSAKETPSISEKYAGLESLLTPK